MFSFSSSSFFVRMIFVKEVLAHLDHGVGRDFGGSRLIIKQLKKNKVRLLSIVSKLFQKGLSADVSQCLLTYQILKI